MKKRHRYTHIFTATSASLIFFNSFAWSQMYVVPPLIQSHISPQSHVSPHEETPMHMILPLAHEGKVGLPQETNKLSSPHATQPVSATSSATPSQGESQPHITPHEETPMHIVLPLAHEGKAESAQASELSSLPPPQGRHFENNFRSHQKEAADLEHKGDYQAAGQKYTHAALMATESGALEAVVAALHKKSAENYIKAKDLKSAVEAYNQAAEQHRKADNPLGVAKAQEEAAALFHDVPKISAMLPGGKTSLPSFREHHIKAMAFEHQGDHQKAGQQYKHAALMAAESGAMEAAVAALHKKSAENYIKAKDLKSAAEAYTQAAEQHSKANNPLGAAKAHEESAAVYKQLASHSGDAYMHGLAAAEHENAAEKLKQGGDLKRVVRHLYLASLSHEKAGDTEIARAAAKRAQAVFSQYLGGSFKGTLPTTQTSFKEKLSSDRMKTALEVFQQEGHQEKIPQKFEWKPSIFSTP